MRTKETILTLLLCVVLSFLAVPKEAYATAGTEEHTHSYDAAGKCTGCDHQAAALVTASDIVPTYHDTMEAAISHAQGKADVVIKVLSNLEIAADPAEVDAALIFSDGTFTLDLNGKTVSSQVHTIGVIEADLTIRDSATGGTIRSEATGGTSMSAAVGVTNGSVTVESGRLEGEYTIYSFDSSSVKVTGGTFHARYCNIYNESGTTVIEGGTFITTETEDICGAIAVANDLTLSGAPVFETIIQIDWAGGTLDLSKADCNAYIIYAYQDMPLNKLLIPEGYDVFDSGGSLLTSDHVLEVTDLLIILEHTHEWTYTLEAADTIKATCSSLGDCTIADRSGTITINAPAELAYDGSAKTASIELAPAGFLEGIDDTGIVYTGDLTDGKPVNAGEYTASITIDDNGTEYQASVSFVITALSIEDAAVTLQETEYAYDGTAKEPGVQVAVPGGGLLNAADYTLAYSKNGEPVDAPVEAGTYTVTVSGQGNYTGEATATFTIAPVRPAIVIEATPEAQLPGKSVSVSVTVTNPGNSQLTDVPEATLTYRIGDGEPQEFTDTFLIPENTALGTEIIITASTPATGNYAANSEEARVVVTDCTHTGTTVPQHDGTSHWNHCSQCKADFDKTAHAGGKATCIGQAVCEGCGQEYGAADPNNHAGGTELRDKKEATATEDGYTGDTYCKGCGTKLSSGTAIPATGGNGGGHTDCNHTGTTSKQYDGTSHWDHCSQCKADLNKETHSGGKATCIGQAVCGGCGQEYGAADQNNHAGGTELRDKKEATATEDGYTGDTYCKGCGTKLSSGTAIPATGGNGDENKPAKKFPFTDVAQIVGHWKFDSVYHVWDADIMNGISGTTLFQPDHPLTRAMFATVLYRMAGEPEVAYTGRFSDVIDGKWYSKAILWANENGIVDGYSNGSYGIDDNITREQIAKMLYLYGKLQGYDVSGRAVLDSFTDAAAVSNWAVEFMQWAVDAEMITGKPNDDKSFRLDPKGEATRAECAKMLMMFRQKYEIK